MDLAAEVVMNRVSESYVKLVLAVGHHDPDYVDACYGSVEWQEELEAVPMPLITVRGVALQRIEELDRDGRPVEDELLELPVSISHQTARISRGAHPDAGGRPDELPPHRAVNRRYGRVPTGGERRLQSGARTGTRS